MSLVLICSNSITSHTMQVICVGRTSAYLHRRLLQFVKGEGSENDKSFAVQHAMSTLQHACLTKT